MIYDVVTWESNRIMQRERTYQQLKFYISSEETDYYSNIHPSLYENGMERKIYKPLYVRYLRKMFCTCRESFILMSTNFFQKYVFVEQDKFYKNKKNKIVLAHSQPFYIHLGLKGGKNLICTE